MSVGGAIGSIAGGLLGRRSGGGQTSSSSAPWSEQQPHLRYVFDEARRLYDAGGPQYYGGPTYVPFSPQTEQALGMIENRALSGSPLTAGAQSYTQGLFSGEDPAMRSLIDTASGGYLADNPYLDRMYDTAAGRVTESFTEDILPALNATFAMSGRTGSPAHRSTSIDASGELADTLANLSSDIYGRNYQSERDRMLSAAGAASGIMGRASEMAPRLAEQDYSDAQRLMGVGGAVEDLTGRMLQDDMARFNYYQNLPEENLRRYLSFVQGGYGGQSTQSTAGNPLTGALGGALSGYQLGNLFGGNPFSGSTDVWQTPGIFGVV